MEYICTLDEERCSFIIGPKGACPGVELGLGCLSTLSNCTNRWWCMVLQELYSALR
jgi:hypothetical protein